MKSQFKQMIEEHVASGIKSANDLTFKQMKHLSGLALNEEDYRSNLELLTETSKSELLSKYVARCLETEVPFEHSPDAFALIRLIENSAVEYYEEKIEDAISDSVIDELTFGGHKLSKIKKYQKAITEGEFNIFQNAMIRSC